MFTTIALLVIIGLLFGFFRHDQAYLDEVVQTRLNTVERMIQAGIEQDTKLISAQLDSIEQDHCVRSAWVARDREALLSCTESRFQKIRQEYQVTHFYFHLPERMNFLRVHNQARHGDPIERFTLAAAAETEKQASGLELGLFGTFTLRVVRPWKIDGELVGYIELGKEIHDILDRVREQLQVQLLVLINKDQLKREKWEDGLAALGKQGDWDHFARYAMGEWSLENPLPLQQRHLDVWRKGGPKKSLELNVKGHPFRGGRLPLMDFTGRPVGMAVVLVDVSEESGKAFISLLLTLAAVLLISVLFAGIGWYFLRRQEEPTTLVEERLQAETDKRRAAEWQLRRKEEILGQEVQARQFKTAEEKLLRHLMRLAVGDEPMQAFLHAALNELLEFTPGLNLLPKAAVFLTTDEGHGQELVMSVSIGMTQEQMGRCRRIAFGECLCGQAAQERDIQFASCVDEQHEIRYPDMPAHGNFSIPILDGETVLGALVLHVPADRVYQESEADLLLRVGDVFSLGICRRYAHTALVAARDEAEAALQAKNNFLAAVSHEIRTPMNGVLGMTELLRDTKLDAQQREFVDSIHRSGRSLITVINDILDYSKVEAGFLELSPIPFDFERAVHDVVLLMMPRAEEKGLNLEFNVTNCPKRLVGDAGRIRQILMNLLNNAITYTRKGKVELTAYCQPMSDTEVKVMVDIKDTGIGISEEDQVRIFNSFPQPGNVSTRKYGVGGLGLAICRQLLTLMGGSIGVESRMGEGSRFWFQLPLPIAEVPEPLPHAQLNGVRILVADDNQMNLHVLEEQLQGYGMRVTTLERMDQVLPRLEKELQKGRPVQLALLDYDMPGLDGEQAARQIKGDERFADLPLVLLTSAGERGDAQRFRDAGFSAYLSKPILSVVLMQTLSSVLGQQGQGGEKPELITRHTVEEGVRTVSGEGAESRSRVLLVEDVPTNQKVAAAMLQRLGLEVDLATTGKEAVELSGRSLYDLIFMDIQMPDMDGLEATRIIREQEAGGAHRTPIIALTANTMELDRELCSQSGMDGFIGKPFDRDDLVMELARWLPPGSAESLGIASLSIPSRMAQGRRRDDAVDRAKLDAVRETLGDEFDDLLDIYLHTAEDMLKMILPALNATDLKEVERLFHSLKSSSASIGAIPMSEMSREMEAKIRAGDTSEVNDAVREMELELQRVRRSFESC